MHTKNLQVESNWKLIKSQYFKHSKISQVGLVSSLQNNISYNSLLNEFSNELKPHKHKQKQKPNFSKYPKHLRIQA